MKKFSRELYGYNKREVNRFLNGTLSQLKELEKKTEEQEKEIQSQNEIIQKLNEQLSYYQSNESSYQDNLNSLGEMEQVQREANFIVQQARQNANRIVNDALIQAEKIELEADTIERNMKVVGKKLKLLAEQQLAMVDEMKDFDLR